MIVPRKRRASGQEKIQYIKSLHCQILKGKEGTVCTNSSELVCANCVFLGGAGGGGAWFFGGGSPLHELTYKKNYWWTFRIFFCSRTGRRAKDLFWGQDSR